MSWGIKITALYLAFVGLIITLVVISMNQKVDLVSKDYYAQEVKYQERIDAIQNANESDEQITFTGIDGKIIFTYAPGRSNDRFNGEICFFRPSDASKDLKVTMQPDVHGMQSVNTDQLIRGMYKVQMSWNNNGKKYFKEDIVFIK